MKNSLEVPTYNNMMCELFQAMKELGGSGTIREIDDKTIEILGVPIEVQEIMHGSSSKTEIEYRLAWTRTYMKQSRSLGLPGILSADTLWSALRDLATRRPPTGS